MGTHLSGRRRYRYALGLMSGTSADGIDAACIRIEGRGERMRVQLVHHIHRAFPANLRRRLLAIMAPAEARTEEIARLHTELGVAFGEAARHAIGELAPSERPAFIGLAGQTVCHYPRGLRGQTFTLQLGSPAHVAAIAGVPVVADFRQSDVAMGGQGAPLVPWTDWVLFHDRRVSRAIQNVGGIGNVTWLPAGGRPEQVVAFDTGPGNMIIDALIARITNGRSRMDRDGRRAGRGQVIEPVLRRWLRHPFFRQPLPRTTGRETFGDAFVDAQLPVLQSFSRNPDDWLATATAFTAQAVADSCRRFIPELSVAENAHHLTQANRMLACEAGHRRLRVELVLAGGGSRNGTLRRMLAEDLAGVRIGVVDEYGIPAEAKEAVSFAMLAVARCDGVASNLTQVTGARQVTPMGAIYATLGEKRGNGSYSEAL